MNKHLLPLFLALLVVARPGLCPADEAPAATEPTAEDTLGIVATAEIASFNQLQQDVTAFGNTIGQPMIAMGLLGAGQLISSPGMLGIDRDKPIRVAFFGKPGDTDDDNGFFSAAVIALPLSDADGAGYFKSVETSATKTSDDNGFRTFDVSGSPLGRTLQAVVADGYAFLSSDNDIPEESLRAIAARGAADLAVPALRGTIRLAAPVAPFAAMIRSGLSEALDNGLDAAGLTDDTNAAAVRADIEYLVDLLGQNDGFALGLDFAAGRGLSIWTRADATPGSDAAALTASLRTPEDAVLSILGDADATGELAGAFDPAVARRFASGYLRVLSLLLNAVQNDADAADEAKILSGVKSLLPLLEKTVGQMDFMTGSFAESVSMNAEGAPSYRYAVGCADAEKMRAANKELRDGLKGIEMLSFLNSEDLDTREANGLVIDRVRMSLDFDKLLAAMGLDSNTPLPPPAAGQLQLLRAMYGNLSENTMETTVRDGTAYITWAPGEAPLDAVLANAAKPAAPGPLSDLFADVPELGTSVLRGYMDYAKVIPSMMKTLPDGAADPNDAEFKAVLEKILATPDRIGFVAWRDNDSLLSAIRFQENVFQDFASWGAYMRARFQRDWEERRRQQQDAEDEDEDDDEDDPLSGLSEEDRKKIGVILEKGSFDDDK